MKQAVAYLRKSSMGGPRSVSWDAQEASVRDLATKDGLTDINILSDWAVSGGSTRGRPQYEAMLARIDAGEVSTVYSFSFSRLSRSLVDFANLLALCARHRVRIVTHQEGVTDLTTATGRAFAAIAGVMAQLERELGSERIKAAHAARRERGDLLGIAPYGSMTVDGKKVDNPAEPVQPLVEAFKAAGSAYGAARIVNAAGHRTRRGALWSSKTVTDVLERAGIAPGHKRSPGAKSEGDWLFFRLLVCPCGHVMTGMDKRSPRYTCYKARHVSDHPRPFGIAQHKLVDAIRAEADHLRPPEALNVRGDAEERVRIEEKRERVLDMYVNGLIDKDGRDRRLDDITGELARLDAKVAMLAIPDGVRWDRRPRVVNRQLRALFERIELGPDLMPRPDGFTWTVPEWRAP